MPYKLLLADDSVTIQRVIELTFADEDVKVTAVGDGQAAIDRIQADPPDIVLADVGMPGRDGYEVAAFVKDNPAASHIPVLLLTGAFEPIDEGRARAVRCDGVLAKPFEPQLLIGRVKDLLSAARGGSAPVETPGTTEAPPAPRDDDDTGPVPVAQATQAFTPEDFSLETATPVPETLGAAPAADVSLDDYFDRLDAAFANLSGTPSGQLKAAITDDGDTSWAPAGSWTASELAPPAGWAADPVPVPPRDDLAGDATPASSPIAVTVADAFAALLHAEQHGGAAAGAGAEEHGRHAGLGHGLSAAPSPSPVVTEALLDDIVRRLAERVGGQGLQEIVARLVSETAERMVREEIERLKAAARLE